MKSLFLQLTLVYNYGVIAVKKLISLVNTEINIKK